MQKCEQNPSDKRILKKLYATKLQLQTILCEGMISKEECLTAGLKDALSVKTLD